MIGVLRQFFRQYQNWMLYAGFSGGADSLALLLLLRELQLEIPFRLTAVHCEHGLRGQSSRDDAAFCQEICRKYGIDFLLYELNVPANRIAGESDETAARRLRQEVWRKLAGNQPDTAVVLAHHAGDRRENLLLRLGRGSGCGGLCGLRPVRVLDQVRYLRPLLKVERRNLEDFLLKSGEPVWREDASNQDTRYRRNFIRQNLLPEWKTAVPGVAHGLNAALDALEEEADLLDRLARNHAERIRLADGSLEQWRKVPPALQGRVLRYRARRELHLDWIPGRQFLAAFRRLVSNGEGALLLSGVSGCRWVCRRGVGCFERFAAVPQICQEWHWREKPLAGWQISFPASLPDKVELDEAYFDAALLPDHLLVSPGRDGDEMIPFGRQNPEKWKVLRVNRKVPRSAAPPLLRMPDGQILWSPMIRHSALAAVSRNTKEIVGFHWKKGI